MTRQSSRRHPDLLELALIGVGLLLAVAFLLPVLVVALPLAAGLLLLLRITRLPALILAPLASSAAAFAIFRGDWHGYVALQQQTGRELLTALLAHQHILVLRTVANYAYALAPAALAYAPFLACSAVVLVSFRSRTTLRYDAPAMLPAPKDVCALTDTDRIDWLLPDVLGRGVISLISAAPGVGKGYWTWALLRAMQTSAPFFGLVAKQPFRTHGWRRRRQALRILWLTEEGSSFVRTRSQFDIAPGLVYALRRDQLRYETWPQLVQAVKLAARRAHCGYVVVDTIRAWCPEAEKDAASANAVMGEVRRQWLAAGLGVLFVHHDSKSGGEHGAGVSGTYGLVGAVDVLVELRRVNGRETARQMRVSRRFGNFETTATLDAGHRYVADDTDLATFDQQLPPPDDGRPALTPQLAGILGLLERAGAAGLSTSAVQQVSGTAKTTVLRALASLEEDGYAQREQMGTAFVWRATTLPPPPPTADPKYSAYLSSPEWAAKRALVLARAKNHCELCGAAPASDDTLEVHHKTYQRLYDEALDDLIAVDAACHRRLHAAQ